MTSSFQGEGGPVKIRTNSREIDPMGTYRKKEDLIEILSLGTAIKAPDLLCKDGLCSHYRCERCPLLDEMNPGEDFPCFELKPQTPGEAETVIMPILLKSTTPESLYKKPAPQEGELKHTVSDR